MTTPHSNRTRILVADDQPDIREALRLLLKGEGFDVETVASPARVNGAPLTGYCVVPTNWGTSGAPVGAIIGMTTEVPASGKGTVFVAANVRSALQRVSVSAVSG